MTETIGVLVVFFILILFAFIFYAQYQKSAIREQQEAATVKRAVATSLKAFYMPEIRCTRGFDVAFTACVDLDKADIFSNNVEENFNFYSNIFGKAEIYLIKDVLNSTEIRIQIYNGSPEEFTKKIPIRFPVSVYDAKRLGTCGDLPGVCTFGILNVDIYD
ncbi:hypothetical protein KY342_01765 [Candidatus Woesearchaeota archaeon]|nr:hypothetical protein [Candidatus Woesearchaeota archaeon]